jgi:hypothetical protein
MSSYEVEKPITAAIPKKAAVVIVEWKDLTSEDHSKHIRDALERAYGASGTGILAIRGMPGFVEAKEAFLPLAHTLATTLSATYLEEHLTDAASLYNAGWSHGKEKLGADKPPDTAKGSFYYNPVTDVPGTANDRAAYPLSYPCNKWPAEDVIPGFQQKAVVLGKLLKEACVVTAKHMDALAEVKCQSYTPGLLHNSMKDTDKVKARLLYYFPLEQSTAVAASDETKQDAEDSWVCTIGVGRLL